MREEVLDAKIEQAAQNWGMTAKQFKALPEFRPEPPRQEPDSLADAKNRMRSLLYPSCISHFMSYAGGKKTKVDVTGEPTHRYVYFVIDREGEDPKAACLPREKFAYPGESMGLPDLFWYYIWCGPDWEHHRMVDELKASQVTAGSLWCHADDDAMPKPPMFRVERLPESGEKSQPLVGFMQLPNGMMRWLEPHNFLREYCFLSPDKKTSIPEPWSLKSPEE